MQTLQKHFDKTVLLSGASANSLVNFRGGLIRALVRDGHRVLAVASEPDDRILQRLKELGATFVRAPVHRHPLRLAGDVRYLWALIRIIRQYDPDVVLAYTHKPIVYTALAKRITNSRARLVVLVTGLGFAFTGKGFAASLARRVVTWAYRLTSSAFDGVMFQNTDDKAVFEAAGMVESNTTSCVVDGSGVDLNCFPESPMQSQKLVFLMIARLLRDKGVREYVAAAGRVRSELPEAQFELVGGPDTNPSGLTEHELLSLKSIEAVSLRGAVIDVRPYLSACTIYVLPSYREGCPRTVLEALATGRPIITTDVPGCRETIVNAGPIDADGVRTGANGMLVPPRDSVALSRAMIRLARDPETLAKMAVESRRLAVERFNAATVNRKTLQFIMGLSN